MRHRILLASHDGDRVHLLEGVVEEVEIPLQDCRHVLDQSLVVEDLDRLRVWIIADFVRSFDRRGVLPANGNTTRHLRVHFIPNCANASYYCMNLYLTEKFWKL